MWASTTPGFRILFQLATNIDSAQITLAWDPNTDPDLAGYRIHYGLLSDQYSNSVDVGNQTSYTLSNLTDGKTYYFAATAYDQAGYESDFSNEVVFNVPPFDKRHSC
jgi:fibronectin type 3 domain-containing protein